MANVGGSSTGPGPKPDAAWVANEFVKRYYEVLAKHPKYLNRFYKEESQFTLVLRNHGGVETRTTVSTTQVRDRACMCQLVNMTSKLTPYARCDASCRLFRTR
jgi:2,3-bisphosphoglycerate-independent phosphoglycerate mutase